MKVTIRDIAEAANVSRGTVDRALHDRPGVNQEVAEKIKKLAKEMGYKPDIAARVLASKKYSKTIGVILSSKGNPFFKDVKNGIRQALEGMSHFGIQSIIREIKGYDEQKQLAEIEKLRKMDISGLIITPANSELVAQKLKDLEDNNIPVVTINTDIDSVKHLAYVGCDYVASGRVAAELIGMMSNGKEKHIAVAVGSNLARAHLERVQGLRETLSQDYKNVVIDTIIENGEDNEISYLTIKELLKKDAQISGICFVGAGLEGGLKAIKEVLPERKLQIVTYDLTDSVRENLETGVISVTVCQEPFQQGYQGVMILGEYLLYGTKPENAVIHTHVFVATKYNL